MLFLLTVLTFCFTVASTAPHADDPDLRLDARGLITSKGYPFERHLVETVDGYILTMHRIPHGREQGTVSNVTRPAVYLQHGLFAGSEDWILNATPEQNLGFLLADAGYDVWMGNIRGNNYSKRHKKLSTSSRQFWDFTFHEMAMRDLPAMADYIAEQTGQEKIYYIGHSQGGMMGIIKFTLDPQWAAKRIKQFHALAPAAYFTKVTSGIKYVAPFTGITNKMFNLFGFNEFAPGPDITKWLAERVCGGRAEILCKSPFFMITGYNTKNRNETRFPVYAAHWPSGTSTRNLVHYGQTIHAKKFRQFDYGWWENIKRYGNRSPPEYHPKDLGVPTVLYSGDLDALAAPGDIVLLEKDIKDTLVAHHKFKNMDHLDFVWGLSAATELYPTVLAELQKDRKLET